MGTNLESGKYAEKIQNLYVKLLQVYERNNQKDAFQKTKETYCQLGKKDKIILSFIGQYSSGKSTIIKALTGDQKIEIDADIKTSQVTPYEWGGILINDTPGLGTGEHAEHDKLTLDAVEISDLLVYCTTSDLFGEKAGNDFKGFAEKYREKLFLVVNKMNKEGGEYEQLVEEYSATINKTLKPSYTINSFHNYFFDAADYIDGKNDRDQGLINESHFEGFIEALNRFIKQKGIMGKLCTPLTILEDSIQNTLIEFEDDTHIQEQMRLIQKIIHAVEEKKKKFCEDSKRELQSFANQYIQKGDEVARSLDTGDYSFTDDDFQKFSDPLQTEMCNAIQSYFEKYANEVDERVQDIMTSQQAVHYFKEEEDKKLKESIVHKNNNAGNILAKIKEGVENATIDAVPRMNTAISGLANVTDKAHISIWSVNGSQLHKIVKNVGKTLGVKFKPFQALKITKNIASVTKWLGPLLTGAATVAEMGGVLLEKRAEKKLEKAKEDIKGNFRDLASEIEESYMKQINEAATEFDKICNSLQDEQHRYDKENQTNNDMKKELLSVQDEIRKLKNEIEMANIHQIGA